MDWHESIRDFQYEEENPGYRREVAFTPDPDGEPMDPEIMEIVAARYAHDNARRRENNLRTENAQLRELLAEHGIDAEGAA